jgi:hypothetical protein
VRANERSALLVHLCAWCYTIHSQKEELSWFHNAVKTIGVGKNAGKHLHFIEKDDIAVVVMGAGVDDTVHVEVEVVELTITFKRLVDDRIAQ